VILNMVVVPALFLRYGRDPRAAVPAPVEPA
jgi:hypothetical protein